MEQRQKNRHETSESWLRAATNDLRQYYTDRGLILPEKIRSLKMSPSGTWCVGGSETAVVEAQFQRPLTDGGFHRGLEVSRRN